MTTETEKIDQYLETHLDQSLEELAVFCAQPSVSAQNLGIEDCAELVASMLKKRGFTAEILPTGGAPVVFGERKGKSDKTLLFYNHYDVQPGEPLELWESPPFSPEIRDGKMYARGVADDKGHITSRLFAIDALMAEYSELPCTVKFVLEGEEETSSLHLHDFVVNNKQRLAADACVWEYGGVDHLDQPTQSLGLRGICYVELSVETANQDVHSGLGGSIFPNAAWRLVWALSTLKDENERILIPSFYDDIVPPSAQDIELMRNLPDPAETYLERYGLKGFLNGIKGGVELKVAQVFQPTCTICGLTSGYQGPGSKTVLPAKASAKIDFRLVPNQRPEKVLKQLREHLDAHGFEDIQIEYMGGDTPARTAPDDSFVKLAVETAEEVYQKPVQIEPMSGGSGPSSIFIEHLNLPVISAGVAHPGAQMHAPNENMRLDLYLLGAKHIARLINQFANSK